MVHTFLSHDEAAECNRNMILHYIRNHGPVSRTDIWEAMKISRASVTIIVKQLMDLSLVNEVGEGVSRGGRKPLQLMLNRNAAVMYILDWFASSIYLTNMVGDIIDRRYLSFPIGCTPSVFSHIIMQAVNEIDKNNPRGKAQMLGMGLSMPGLIDRNSCILLSSNELGWKNVNLKSLFVAHFDGKIFVDRATNIMALGEYDSHATGSFGRLMLILLSRTGIGCSFVTNGICQYGSNHMIGEIGHMKFPSKAFCSCGHTGCLEAIVFDRFLHNDNVIDTEIISYIALAIASSINIIDPMVLILTGDLISEMHDALLNELKSKILSNVLNVDYRRLDIFVSESTTEMTIKGMCSYIFTSCFSTVHSLT